MLKKIGPYVLCFFLAMVVFAAFSAVSPEGAKRMAGGALVIGLGCGTATKGETKVGWHYTLCVVAALAGHLTGVLAQRLFS